MHILLLPNSFKGSLSALRVTQIARTALTGHTVNAFPLSDGGDGFIDFFRTADPRSRWVPCTAKNAFLQNKRTGYLFLSDGKTAVIETAKICGLGSAAKKDLSPLTASSYGVGQVLLKAAKRGAKTIYVGLGGVACNDGGAGMAAACGARLLNARRQVLPLGAQALLQLKQVDIQALQQHFSSVRIIGVADVVNPLLGPKSSAKVFGPQKGATPAQVKLLDKAMAVWARALQKATGKNISRTPSTAAAGAIAAGLYGCFGAELQLGADDLLRQTSAEKYAKRADLIITCEGKLDRQTFYGKAPLAVLKLAKKYHKPVLFICGQLDEKARRNNHLWPAKIAVLSDWTRNSEEAKKHAALYLRRVFKSL